MRAAFRRALHRQLWQRLPYRLRRAVFFRATAALAPRPDPGASPRLPVIVAGTLTAASGLGESARLCLDALRAEGLPAYGIDLTAGLLQPRDFAYDFPDGRHLAGAGTLVMHVNAPLMGLALLRLGRALVRGKYVVGYWAWELPDVPADWRPGMRSVHEVWVPSRFTAQAVARIAGRCTVRVLPHPLPSRDALTRPAGNRRPFTVLTVFNMTSSMARKNPLAAIDAFRGAFGDDPGTRLLIKCSNSAAFAQGRDVLRAAVGDAANIRFIDAVFTGPDLDALYREADVLVSLHRSEGFGLTLAEAMLRGLPVIATDWSGSTDFIDRDSGCPVGYHLTPAIDVQGTYHFPQMRWADADTAAAAAAMRRLRDDPDLACRVGAAGQRVAAAMFSTARYASHVRGALGLEAGFPSCDPPAG